MYATIEPLVIGAWYRGIPFKKYEQNINNHESLVFLAGFRQDKFSIGYSYDLTISTLGASSGGARDFTFLRFRTFRIQTEAYEKPQKTAFMP
jgi:hypothetical protein